MGAWRMGRRLATFLKILSALAAPKGLHTNATRMPRWQRCLHNSRPPVPPPPCSYNSLQTTITAFPMTWPAGAATSGTSAWTERWVMPWQLSFFQRWA